MLLNKLSGRWLDDVLESTNNCESVGLFSSGLIVDSLEQFSLKLNSSMCVFTLLCLSTVCQNFDCTAHYFHIPELQSWNMGVIKIHLDLLYARVLTHPFIVGIKISTAVSIRT